MCPCYEAGGAVQVLWVLPVCVVVLPRGGDNQNYALRTNFCQHNYRNFSSQSCLPRS